MQTPFYEQHVRLGAKMVDFHGWQMPLQYSGIIDEHKAVRSNVGLFDVSHMGRFKIIGSEAKDTIQKLIVNDIYRISKNQAIYSPMCYENGGIVDDVIVYQLTEDEFLLVVNSSNIEKDFKWVKRHLPASSSSCRLEDITNDVALLALQGPNAEKVLSKEFGIQDVKLLKQFQLTKGRYFDQDYDCIISRTGYTGEDGFELFIDSRNVRIWDDLLEKGKQHGIQPAGLGARDTLRLEAGLMLYGNDIDENITPLEAPLKWTVKFEKGDFVGKEALEKKEIKRKLRGFQIVDSKRIARRGNKVFCNNKEGTVTSGTFSPTLNKPIGFCLIPTDVSIGDNVKIEIGSKQYNAEITATRFFKHN